MGDRKNKEKMSKSLLPELPEATSLSVSELEEQKRIEHAPMFWTKPRGKKLSKQLSMLETTRNAAWEKRCQQQILHEERMRDQNYSNDMEYLTDEDLNDLRGSIELGFGFNKEHGQELCKTLPALNLLFAVNRQFSTSPILSPNTSGSNSSLEPSTTSYSNRERSSFGSPRSDSDSWKILRPGDDPQKVKRRLRHWAQAVACSVMQSRDKRL